jgi:3-oxoacyl-[acyl-carrier protein] reductase
LRHAFNVAVWDINHEDLFDCEEKVNLLPISCDITNASQIELALTKTLEYFGRIDVLVNNAGVLYSEPLINVMSREKRHSIEKWKMVMDINLTAPFVISSYIAEYMISKRILGVIVNISSVSASGNAGQTAYSAAKAGLESMTKVWAKELGRFGIRSVAIAPGFIETESTHQALSEDILEGLRQSNPLRKLGKTEHISAAVVFAINNEYANGCVFKIDGGLLL